VKLAGGGQSGHGGTFTTAIGAPEALLKVGTFPGKGRGLVATRAIPAGTLIEVAPVIPLTEADRPPRGSVLYDYPFLWDDPPFVEAIALGLVSLANHSGQPNAAFAMDFARYEIRLTALRDIRPGEELLIDYENPLWFDPR
jgi:SET domain-containing protein